MNWIQDRWQRLRFNRLDFDRKYVVDQVLSQKPRSRVLLVHQRGGDEQTIMKLSDPGAANPLEARCLRSLRHPSIAGCIGHGFTRDRRLWMETQYVDGEPLSSWLDDQGSAGEGPMDSADEIFLHLLSVVQYLHCCGWMHGDLSPQNILISPDARRVVLIDFEYAREIDADSPMSMPRRHSVAFASPHELAGGGTTEACEQFALGKIGLMLFGHFNGRATEEIEAVLGRASSLRAEDRYPSLSHVAQEFRVACHRAPALPR